MCPTVILIIYYIYLDKSIPSNSALTSRIYL
nr:MAG TPA: hypothetical protein [Caudoviricetes sp.]